MATAMEFTCENGCRVRVADGCCHDLTAEEAARRRADLWAAICAVCQNAARESGEDGEFSG